MKNSLALLIVFLLVNACAETPKPGTFAYDLSFLGKTTNSIILKDSSEKCQLLLNPDYQGRVMTSTANGVQGRSYGWINYDLIAAGKFEEHINVFGGEDRFWLGPEGGQYSIFFKKNDDFTLENWQTPKQIDTEPFDLLEFSDIHAIFKKRIQLTNYQGFAFDVDVRRKVSLLNKNEIMQDLHIELPPAIAYVGFQSENTITNRSQTAWSKDTGLLSVWILGMFKPSDNTTVIIPYTDSLALNTRYFGEVPADKIKRTHQVVLFKGDGKHRAKIGVPAQNATGVMGSYDSANQILTVVKYSLSNDSLYVNSLWEQQAHPYQGDIINSYNDGPMKDGSQLGPFYELESSSATRELSANESINHLHKTYHFEGSHQALNTLAQKILKFDLDEITWTTQK